MVFIAYGVQLADVMVEYKVFWTAQACINSDKFRSVLSKSQNLYSSALKWSPLEFLLVEVPLASWSLDR